MALRPAESELVHERVDDVRIYLDDIASLMANLEAYGELLVEAYHHEGETSVVESLDDLTGRSDVWQVVVSVVDRDDVRLGGPYKPISVEVGYGTGYTLDHGRADLRRVADHFMKTLEKVEQPWWRRRRRHVPHWELIFERRATAKQTKARKRHDYKISLISGLGGALIGAAVTVLVTLAAGK